MNPILENLQLRTRRYFLKESAMGLGALAINSMLSDGARADTDAGAIQLGKPHFTPKAKRVIYLHMTGSPPNLDLFDYKPELVRRTGEDCPKTFLEGKEFAFTSGTPTLLGTPQKFQQVGQGGTWMSAAIPKLHEVADHMCLVHSMHTEQFNHAPAELLIYTGSPRAGAGPCFRWQRPPSSRQ